MKNHDEFWLALHNLAINLNSDSATPKEKAQTLFGLWQSYPPVAGNEIGVEFRMVLSIFLELESLLPKAGP